MKSFLSLVLILFFFVCISKQQISVSSIYAEFNKVRSQYCLPPFTVSSSLESTALTNANNKCDVSKVVTVSNGYVSISISTGSIAGSTGITNGNNSFYNSLNKWSCATDNTTTTSLNDPMFARFVLVPNQAIGCSFSVASPCQYSLSGTLYNALYLICQFQTYIPIGTRLFPVSNCTCTSSQPTTAPSTTTPTTTPSTNRPSTITPTTAPSTTTPTTAPSTTTPTTAPSTTTPTTNPTTVSNWLNPQNSARSCVGVSAFTWDESLASDAYKWAGVLAGICGSLSHSNTSSNPPRDPVQQGENLFSVNYGTNTFSESAFISTSVEGWVKENGNYSCLSNTCSINATNTYLATLSNGMKLTLNACGHYTAIIWINSTRVGCAYQKCANSNAYYGVCRYSPGGNYIGRHPLTDTSKCSNCAAINRALTTVSGSSPSTSTTQTKTEFFKSDSEIYVFALTIIILVVVISIFVVILLNFIRSRKSPSDDYQLLETK